MQRYFLAQTYEEAKENGFHLAGADYHHAINVMRMATGDKCYLAFSDKQVIIAEIEEIQVDQVDLLEISLEQQDKELPIAVTIASAYPKGDKLELIVQKGTELGADSFIGFPGQTSVVKWDAKKLAKKVERLNKISKEAAEQSHRQHHPTVDLLNSMSELTAQFSNYDAILVAYEEAAKDGEKGQLVQTLSRLSPGQRLLVIFGPEGGLAPTEVAEFQKNGAKLCALGPRILRTETAPFYLLSAISYQFELLQ